ncbi:MAG TPA: hypothetical protein VMG13_03620, partial [Trebonia sp.]|nr:hypothetical protein [Trebonia sp.]
SSPERTVVTPQSPAPPQPADPASAEPPRRRAAPAEARPAEAAPAQPAPPAPPAQSPDGPARPPAPRGAATAETLRQEWDAVLEALKAKRRVAWMLLSNASVVSLDEGVLTLRFPRQGDVKGFQSSGYEDLLKQVLQARFGVNVVVRAVTGGDPPPGERRRPGPGPVPPPPVPPVPGDSAPVQPPAAVHPAETPDGAYPPADEPARPAMAEPPPPPAPPSDAAGQRGEEIRSFGIPDLPPPPDEEFDPDDEDMSGPVSAELTGMALVQRELGGQIIAEYED